MDVQKMLELLRKELITEREAAEKRADDRFQAWRGKTAATREELVAETEATREETRAIEARMEVTQAEREAIKARTKAMREIIGASNMEMVFASKPEIEEETMACRETTEACLEEEKPVSVDMKPEAAERREVPVVDVEVMPVGEPKKKRRKDRNKRNMKNSARENCGAQKKLAVTRRRTSRRVESGTSEENQQKYVPPANSGMGQKDQFQEIFDPRKELAADKIRMTRHAEVVRRMRQRDMGNAAERSQTSQVLWKRGLQSKVG
jgi:hypothetical protein